MNDTPQDAWFYSREGEKIGPVTFADLRIKAKDAGLNPRLDMVWTQGMPEWKPAGEIADLFERRAAPEPQETLAPAADPYQSPQHESAAELMGKEGDWPGARRRTYLIMTLLFPALWTFVFAAASGFLSAQFGAEIMLYVAMAANFVPVLVMLVFSLKRLVNVGMSRWWFLGNFVPILNLWVGFRLFACPGGYAYHKKLDGAGKFLAVIYWLLIVIGVLAVIAMIAVLFGALGTPEIQQQVREALRMATTPKP